MTKVKKVLFVLVVLILISCIVFVGCSSKSKKAIALGKGTEIANQPVDPSKVFVY